LNSGVKLIREIKNKMKLYVKDPSTGEKIFLDRISATRHELTLQLGSTAFNVNGRYFSVDDVLAEKSSDSTALGMVVGGLIGLLGGAPGVLIGGAIGGALGNSGDSEEQKKVDLFNGSTT
tara:strand:- start:170 stop:529 length:360 start_codon:yes stop_codon:yes gene_type:complete